MTVPGYGNMLGVAHLFRLNYSFPVSVWHGTRTWVEFGTEILPTQVSGYGTCNMRNLIRELRRSSVRLALPVASEQEKLMQEATFNEPLEQRQKACLFICAAITFPLPEEEKITVTYNTRSDMPSFH